MSLGAELWWWQGCTSGLVSLNSVEFNTRLDTGHDEDNDISDLLFLRLLWGGGGGIMIFFINKGHDWSRRLRA